MGFRRKNLGATLSERITLSEHTIIVTGARGRVGRILARAWAAEPPPGLRILWSSRGKAAGDRAADDRASDDSTPGDLAWDIGAGAAPDWPADAILLHLAGTTGARDPGANPALIPALAEACRRNRLAHLVFLSTAAIYAPGPLPARETDPPAPANPYGAAKLEAEHLLAGSGLALTILRLGNLAGADALLAPRDPGSVIRLDPIPGEPRGPMRSWIGPLTFARTIAALLTRIAGEIAAGNPGGKSGGEALPPILNLSQAPPLGMAELLAASDLAWDWAAPNPAVVPAAMLDNTALAKLIPLPLARPGQIIAEIRALRALPEA
ncbi:NAD-dependent epimerase/dehydratase family protein [Pseudogemmobacter bohemicus]|uniref:NAD-dependent epimerase/dehydratase family protein n=1 Tax=Pseudogemmobacter bohemicus TaxID=2250708 RepID=UPI0018E4DBEF|nr:SDR family oxidoreductase [Pseudogemmobacter bohemicus]